MASRPVPPPSNVNEHVSRFDPQAAAQEFEHETSPGMRDQPLTGGEHTKRIIGLVAGPLLAIGLYLLMPGDLAVWPRLVAATAVLMGVWWMTEALPIPATALLPLVVFPLGVPAAESDGGVTFDSIGASYGNNIIFLFMGGFMLALAMQRWNLHRRIALGVLKLMGAKTVNLVLGFMIATGFISMWVSNTATAVMMLPIGVSILVLVQRYGTEDALAADAVPAAEQSAPGEAPTQAEIRSLTKSNFGTALMLGIAYAASIGSLGTIIGTPPNTLLAGHMATEHGIEIGFGQWMLVGVPIAVVLLLACWLLLTRVMFRPEIDEVPGGRDLIAAELARLGRMSAPEAKVLVIFVLAALAWITVPLLSEYVLGLDSPLLSDAAIAMVVGLVLFLLPAGGGAGRGVRLLDWEAAKDLPWGVLLLFGGGLALSGQFSKSGLSTWLGEQVRSLGEIPVWVLVVIAAIGILLLTEMTSNTATAATFLPVASGVALGTGVEPLMLAAPVALAATCAFMLPVATPPNAIAYGSGYVTIGQMVKGGVWLNIIAAVLISVASMTLLVWVFGL
ncbi:SLC13 family permease [Micrococcus endophyticus]|uniref:Sodium-dependent dicarboxylate transporter SdcS n=1 Tax=Micrococcus endophyticus TaxID=455343 RepID=A0A7W9JHN4_9MICC|nr:DASS family sodium-coupled anion symporter [Micrococcus endophyticus]MBB5847676.1 sodium-dependent dicarboxylate transporter 2/3/5 [Micrococcus endophyticus]